MTNTHNYQEKLTLNRSVLQVKMNFNIEFCFVDDGKVGLVQNLVERMDLSQLFNLYSRFGRKPAVDSVTMLKVLISCYSIRIFSSRDREEACKFDVRVKYLLVSQKAPDHPTINRYRKELESIIKEIFTQFSLVDSTSLSQAKSYLNKKFNQI